MKKYFFALGTNFNLSLAELSALFPNNKWQKHHSIVFSDFFEELPAENLMLSLGGIIKIGEIIKEFSLANRRALSDSIKKEIISIAENQNLSGKFNFGFSFYGSKTLPGDFFKLGLAIKKDLKNLNIPSRMVTSRESVLSSVIVEQNKLIDNGVELCLIIDKNRVFLGKTLVVQPFKDLSKRDFGRPNRDDYSGMIPPKLAQIMINLARRNDVDFKNKKILDPFCGSGTILMEAYLMGFKNIIGSDLSEKAILDSQKNIDWIIDLSKDKEEKNIQIFQSDVLEINKKIEESSIDFIVCEPYLGPQRGYRDFSEVIKELNNFYSNTLKVLHQVLKVDGYVVMVWPQFRAENKIWKMNPEIGKFILIPTLNENIENNNNFNNRNTVVYGREEQKVWREIVVLKK